MALAPADIPALRALVATMTQGGRRELTQRPLRRLLALAPDDPACMAALAGLFETRSDWARRALAVEPASEEIALLAISKLLAIGDAPAAAKLGAGDRLPRTPRLQAARICASFLLEEAGPATSLALAREFDERFARSLPACGASSRKRSGTGRRLRIGYLAGRSFALHTTAFTLLPTIEGHDRARIEAFCYSDVPADRQDQITARFRAASTGFRDVSGLSDEAVAAAIVDDDIDVVIDSLGYPPGSRVLALARRPGRLQVNWMPMGSLGLDAVDLVLGDRWIIPQGAEDWFIERVERLPLAYVYDPLADLPNAVAAPSRGVVFGSFNQLAKLSGRTIRLWARILNAVPGSRLVLKAGGFGAEAQARVRSLFSRAGVAPDVVELRLPTPDIGAHMASYADIDIALDPTPYGGVITTLEAMWMGVPVITLAGDRVLGRYSHAFVSVLGLPELSATDEDDYVAKAVALAADDVGRAALRGSLRDRMRASPLCDGRAMAASIENAVRDAMPS